MAQLKINYSEATVKKPTVPSASGIGIDPYYAQVAGAGFSKIGAFVEKIIKDTKKQNEKNEIRKLKIPISEKIQTEYAKYSSSSNPEDIKTFIANTDISKFSLELKGKSKNVKNGIEAYLLSTQHDLRWKLFSEINARHAAVTELGNQSDLDALTLKMAANDVVTRMAAYKEFNAWFRDIVHVSQYDKVTLKKLHDDKLAQAKRWQLEFGIKTDPYHVLRNPELLLGEIESIYGKHDAETEAEAKQLYAKAKTIAVNKQSEIDWDNIQLEKASTEEKINNFSEIIVRLNNTDDPDWKAKVPSIDDLVDMFKQDQINSAQYAALLDFYANPKKLSKDDVVEMINAQLAVAETVEDIDELEKQVNFDHEFAAGLNIKDIGTYKKIFDKYKEDFPAAQQAQDFETTLETNLGKVSQLGGMFNRDKGMTIQDKLIRDKGVKYYRALVYDKNVLPEDAYVMAIEKYTNDKNMPSIYNVLPLFSINLKPPKDTDMDGEAYFNEKRKLVSAEYKNGNIDIQTYMEDVSSLDVIEDLWEVRHSILKSNKAAFDEVGKASAKVATVKKKNN